MADNLDMVKKIDKDAIKVNNVDNQVMKKKLADAYVKRLLDMFKKNSDLVDYVCEYLDVNSDELLMLFANRKDLATLDLIYYICANRMYDVNIDERDAYNGKEVR